MHFTLDTPRTMDAGVYDVHGTLVRPLPAGRLDAGHHQVGWDGRDAVGVPVGEGVYFVRVVGPGANLLSKAVRMDSGTGRYARVLAWGAGPPRAPALRVPVHRSRRKRR